MAKVLSDQSKPFSSVNWIQGAYCKDCSRQCGTIPFRPTAAKPSSLFAYCLSFGRWQLSRDCLDPRRAETEMGKQYIPAHSQHVQHAYY